MKRFRSQWLGALAVLALLIPMVEKAHAGWGVNNQHHLIPLYVYPFWWVPGNDWYRACDAINPSGIGSTMIMNPDNGPGSAYNPDYDHVIDYCHQKGHNVIGYVDTSYGVVPIETVKANIDKYYGWYTLNGAVDARVDGIFLDQMSNDPATAPYYHEIFNYVKTKSTTHDDVVGNPGAAAATDWQLNDTTGTQAADEIMIFEGPITGQYGFDSFALPEWARDYPASDIVMLVYNVPQEQIASVCSTLKTNHAGLVYVTDATITSTSTPWNSLPSAAYMSAFTSACH